MSARSGKSYVGTAALIVALAALTVAIFAVFYHRELAPLRAGTAEEASRFTSLTGLNNQAIKNALDPRYTDADGDLVADPPTDPAQQIDPPVLTFSYVIVDDDDPFKSAFKELMAALSKATGKPVKYVSYTDVTTKLRDMRDGRLAIAGLNTGSVPIAVCTAGFLPLVQAADADGVTTSHMEIIVPADSPLSRLSDLRGHELTLTQPNSNSGYKAPLVTLRENRMVPPDDYLIRYSQGHVQSILGVKDKRFEAAAVAGDVLARMEKSGQIAPTDYKVIFTSDQTFPGAAIGCEYNLKPELVAEIRDTMLHFDWKGTGLQKLFAAEGKVKFVPADYKKGWEDVRRIDESIGFTYALPAAVVKPTTAPATRTATAH